MDPTANLDEQRRLAARILYSKNTDGFCTDAGRLAELVQALDEWISKGGFLPRSWARSDESEK